MKKISWEKLYKLNVAISNKEVQDILNKFNFKKSFRIFNVVGTNGKGSVSGYMAQGFKRIGYRVGLFTSPHIVIGNERISINGVQIKDVEAFDIADQVLRICDDKIHFFKLMYLVAMIWFQKQRVDVVVLEAGIGGSNDVTTIIDGDWGVVTSIALDHTELLGDNKKAIAMDKAGIINKGMKFYIPSSLDKNISNIFFNKSKKELAEHMFINNKGKTYKERNTNLASKILKDIIKLDIKYFVDPFGRTLIAKNNNSNFILDVSHNYEGIKNTINYLKHKKTNYDQVVLSINNSKDIKGINKLFKNKKLFVYKINNSFRGHNDFKNTEKISDILEFKKNQNKDTLFIGSFYLISEVIKKEEE